jgi:hypothetical protein
MLRRATIARIAAAIAFIISVISPLSVQAQFIPGTSIPNSVTHLVISNQSPQNVIIAVTVPGGGTQDGCTNTIANIFMINVTPGQPNTMLPLNTYQPGNTVNGTFPIASGQSWEIVNTLTNPKPGPPPLPPSPSSQNCLQGLTITFGQLPQCANHPPAFPTGSTPGPPIPNGVNQCEPTLNLPNSFNGVSDSAANESCDITCLNGANAIIQLTLTSPTSGALNWTYDASGTIGPGQSFSTQNSWVNVARGCDNNCSPERPGVFPYGCSQCNIFPDPNPGCLATLGRPASQFCAAQNGLPPNTGCNFQRSPNSGNPQTAQFGGSVVYTFLGPAIPPAKCVPSGGGGGGGKGGSNGFMKFKVIKKPKPFKIKEPKPFKFKEPKVKEHKPFKIKEPKPFKDFNKFKLIDP